MATQRNGSTPKKGRAKARGQDGSDATAIAIRGARQNNLRSVDVTLPRNALVAVTGISGSGKSSLAFDTLFREGQRRFLETLSAYARQFLGGLQKPEVDSIEGLSPAIAVDQKSIARGNRSTVGTLTEIVDHLRVLFARAGVAYSPWCDLPVESRTPEAVVQELLDAHAGARLVVAAPLVKDRKGSFRALFQDLQRRGFVRARVDGEIVRLEEAPELERYKQHSIEVVVDRLKPDPENPSRLRDAVEQALELGEGELVAIGESSERTWSTQRVCPETGNELPPLEPRLFSFNSPHGACTTCDGLGVLKAPSEAAVVRDPSLTIREGALAVTKAAGNGLLFPNVDFEFLERVGNEAGFDLDTPWKDMTRKQRRLVLEGTGSKRYRDSFKWNGARSKGTGNWNRIYRGVLGNLRRAWERGSRRKMVDRFLSEQVCPDCGGSRLNEFARFVRLGDVRIQELTSGPVEALVPKLRALQLTDRQARIARDLLQEIERRAQFLVEVGLGYLTLDRGADTLSGGEAQRIRLAAQLGAGLQGVLYVLDEPSIGLHARDHERLLGALARLRDAGNSVVVVEHDETTLRSADWLIDVGPAAGRHGGEIVSSGPPAEVARSGVDTPTGRLLRGEIHMPAPESRREGSGEFIEVRGASAFNLKGVDVRIPLGTLTAVTGVSGSGKSTLVDRTLKRALLRHLERETPDPGPHDAIAGLEHVDDLVAITAAPIGRTPRSNPATYTKVFGPIRELFASLPEAKMRGYTKSRFSFNVAGGRCEECLGAGVKVMELQFLSPVTVPCDECGGRRFQEETLDVRYREHSIADVLAMTVEDAVELFHDHPLIVRPLQLMVDVGLGYLTLGQPSPTLSGGEAQRIKLVTYLAKRPSGHTLFLLDEPTTGLHMEDVGRLVGALQRLVDKGHSVLVIEHNLELVQAADHVIDLGPEGGEGGGRILATGTPEEIAAADTPTGVALRSVDDRRRLKTRPLPRTKDVVQPDALTVEGAQTHNLTDVDVSIPRGSLTVVTGPSGSGKSSLALDTIYTEGRRRFVESLSTYARQFLGTKDKPPVERIEGLGPSVAVEASTVRGHPRSTVATTTEIHDQLRVLFARAGEARCPYHGEPLEPADPSKVTRKILKATAELEGSPKGWILAPLHGHSVRVTNTEESLGDRLRALVPSWTAAGFVRVMIDGKEHRLDAGDLPFDDAESVDLVVDRVSFSSASRARIADAVEQAATASHGRVSILVKGGPRVEYSTHGACTICGFQLAAPLEPRHFSFNTHVGACKTCDGIGSIFRADPAKLITDPSQPITDGAIGGKLGRYLVKGKGYYEVLLRTVAKSHRVDLRKPFEALTEKQQALLMRGVGARDKYEVKVSKQMRNFDFDQEYSSEWNGLCGHIDAWHAKTDDPEWAGILERVMTRQICPDCHGERLEPAYRHVYVGRKRIPEVLSMTVEEGLAWTSKLKLRKAVAEAMEQVLAELRSRLALLERVGLGYLTLDRATATLSGGEARRVRLSASLGSELVGVCYVLDEPTVGLHPRDIDRLAGALEALRDAGNTVIVVEHDAELMGRADHIVDMGPGAGVRGGRVVASGTPDDVRAHPESGTARYMRGEIDLAALLARDAESNDREAEEQRAEALAEAYADAGDTIRLRGASANNLRGVDLDVRFGELLGVCGPSGSGKSTLVLDTLVPAIAGETSRGRWKSADVPEGTRLAVVDASPIGRTPHSVPATYVELMPHLRELFAKTPEARMKGYTPSYFSFNSTKGRCPACDGRGATLVEMQFLSDLWLTCEECDGRRYKPEVLEVRYRGKSIADVLEMSVDEALAFFEAQPAIERILSTLSDVGLGYMALGQSSTTLSGGEAQRIKLASELWRAEAGGALLRSVLVLDEPSTGLAATDVEHLARCLGRLARRGNAVVVIEHHTELLEICERLVELGPEGGEAGGRIVASGTPAELAKNRSSVTGRWLFTSPDGGKRRAPKATRPRATPTRQSRSKAKTAKKKAKKTTKKAATRRAAR
ncbi:MAG: excinuclease ABC subunit UvrA [Planctomycetota bacterium]